MPSITDLYPSKYLKSADIKGREPTVTIRAIEVEEITGQKGKEHKPVLYFEGKEKGMVLNRTNADMIADFLGPDYTQWAGHAVTLYVTRVQSPQGGMTDGLRVKRPASQKQAVPVVQQRPGYKLSTTAPAPTPAEVAADEMAEDIPF